jgi:hypothetical protein
MRANFYPSSVALIALLIGSAAAAQEFSPLRPRDAVRSATTFVAGLESPGKCPANIEADLERAVGVVIRPDTLPFFLFVPQKALEKMDLEGKEIRKGSGVPVGYLFPFWTPVVDGQLLDKRRLQNTVYHDPKAGRIDFNCLVLTASPMADDRYFLNVFGTGLEPLFSVPLDKAGKAETSVVVKDLDVRGLRLKVELSFGDGRRASIEFGTPRRPGE